MQRDPALCAFSMCNVCEKSDSTKPMNSFNYVFVAQKTEIMAVTE